MGRGIAVSGDWLFPLPPTHTDAPEAYAGQDKRTWVDDVFKGTLTNETKCLCCETVSHLTVTWSSLAL